MRELLIVLFFTTTLIGSNISAQIDTTPNENFSVLTENFRAAYTAMYKQESFKTVEAYYGESVSLIPEFQVTILRLIPAALYYQAFFKRFDVESYTRDRIELLAFGENLLEIGEFQKTIVDSYGVYPLTGYYLNICEQTPNGKATLITENWNYNRWFDYGDKLRFNHVPSVRMALEQHPPIKDNISFEIKALNTLMEEVIMQRDAKRWALFFSEYSMVFHGFSTVSKGRAAVYNHLIQALKDAPTTEALDIKTNKIIERDGYVIEYSSAIEHWRDELSSRTSTSKSIKLWKREPNGSLKIFRMMTLYD